MKRYTVEVTDAAMAAIHAQARYVAIKEAQPVNAQSWLGAVWDAIDALETFPRAHPIAEENDDVEYEVRFVLAGRESLLFTVDDERATVWVIALRGQGQLPKPENLPHSTGALEIERTIAANTVL
jgi:plasmid stabilization system protein ParE